MVRDASRQQMLAIKEAPVSHPLQPLGHPQLLQKKMKVLLLCIVLGLLYAGHGEAQLLLKPVPGVVQAGRRSWGICVCVSLLGFGHVDP